MATYSGIKKIKIGDNIFELAVDWSDITNQPTIPTNTDKKLEINSVISGTTYYPIVATDSTDAATRQYDKNGFVYSVYRNASSIGTGILTLGNDKASGTGDNVQGKIILFGNTIYSHTIEGAPTSPRTITLPDKTGTVALTSDIPTQVSDLTNDSGFISSYTDEKLKWTASTTSNTYYPLQSTSTATTSTANTLNGISFYQYYNTAGGYRRLDLGNTTAYKSTGGAYGTIRLYGAAATYYGDLVPGVLGTTSGDGHISANRTWTLPDKTGTIALTSDVPTVPTNISAFTNDSGYLTSYTETDPTVPSWAKASTKPSYTASEISGLVDFFYPVGSYYETSDTTFDPNTAWGGTWSLEAEGQVHVSAGSTYSAGTTYGSDTHTHTTGDLTLTDAQMAHGHSFTQATYKATGGAVSEKAAFDTGGMSANATHTHTAKNGGAFVQNGTADWSADLAGGTFFKCGSTTASASVAHTHSVPKHTHGFTQPTISINTNGSVANLSGASSTRTAHNHGATGSSTRNSWQPSIAVNRWHRTA